MLKIKELELKFKQDLADVEKCVQLVVKVAGLTKELIDTAQELTATLDHLKHDLSHPWETVDQ